MTIRINIKNIYGKDLMYPLDFIKELETLTSAKTLSPRHIQALKIMGFTFEQESKAV